MRRFWGVRSGCRSKPQLVETSLSGLLSEWKLRGVNEPKVTALFLDVARNSYMNTFLGVRILLAFRAGEGMC